MNFTFLAWSFCMMLFLFIILIYQGSLFQLALFPVASSSHVGKYLNIRLENGRCCHRQIHVHSLKHCSFTNSSYMRLQLAFSLFLSLKIQKQRNLTIVLIFTDILGISQIYLHLLHFFPCPFVLMSRTIKCSKAKALLFCRMNLLEVSFSTSYQTSVAPTFLQATMGSSLLQGQTLAQPAALTSAVRVGMDEVSQGLPRTFRTALLPHPLLLCRCCHLESVWGEAYRLCTEVRTFKVTIRNRLSFMETSAQKVIGNVTCLQMCVLVTAPLCGETVLHPHFTKAMRQIKQLKEEIAHQVSSIGFTSTMK